MIKDFVLMYGIVHLFYFIFAVYISAKVNGDVMRKDEYTVFRVFLVIYMIYLSISAVWGLQEYDVIHFPYGIAYLICFLSMISVVLNAFCFYCFIFIRKEKELVSKRIFWVLSLIPLMVILGLMISSFWTQKIFSVTEDHHIKYESMYPIIPILACSYLLAVLISGIVGTVQSISSVKRKENLTQVFSVIFILICAVVDVFFDKSMIIPMAIYAAIFFIFINVQESGIYTDMLTSMNNRRKANEYLEIQLENVSEQNAFYLYMCDVNSFKQINDIHGHSEGDQALIIIAGVLKKVISRYSGFAARYGGDEFILSWKQKGDVAPDALVEDIHLMLQEECKRLKKPYEITVSIGYAKCTDSNVSLNSCVKAADEMLYERKREYHRVNA